MRRVLGISGKRFTGKDTFAELLVSRAAARGVALCPYALAAESKRMFAAAMHSQGVELDLARLGSDRTYKETWRPALTQFTARALDADPHVFVRQVAQRIVADPRPALISDLRLRLELDWLRPRFDLWVVRLVRSDRQRAASGWQHEPAKELHYTETDLDDPGLWSQVVENDGTIAELLLHAERVLSTYLPGSAAPHSGR
jgi:phosphomevalonate kinase